MSKFPDVPEGFLNALHCPFCKRIIEFENNKGIIIKAIPLITFDWGIHIEDHHGFEDWRDIKEKSNLVKIIKTQK